jgi:aspartate/methionine/tyrosine aminotransferase
MVSSRLPSDLSHNATTRALHDLQRQAVKIADLTESNPTRVGLNYPADLLAPLVSPAALIYDPQPLGAPEAREAVASDFARRGQRVGADRIALTASTSEAYALLFKLLCDPGDSVLVPRPSYPLFEHLTVLESVVARAYRLEYHGAWRVDVDQLRASVDDRTRAVLVVSPNNPTGSFLHEDDLVEISRLCVSHDLVLIGDEVFADYPLDAAPKARPVLSATDVIACSLGGLSKSSGMPQLKLGWIGFGGPNERVTDLMNAYEVVADTYLSVSTPVQTALNDLLTAGAAIRRQIQARITRNLGSLRDFAAHAPSVSVLNVEGGWSAVVKVPAYRSEEALVLELLREDHILVHPGYFFDFESEAFIVVSLLSDPDTFDRSVDQVLKRASRASGRP